MGIHIVCGIPVVAAEEMRRASINSSIKQEEEDKKQNFTDFVRRKFYEMFITNLPIQSLSDLPPNYVLSAGAIAYVIILSIFVYFALNGLKKAISQEYMSLSVDSGVCEPIKKSISDKFTVDANGVWNGQAGYTFSLEQYTFIATQLEVSDHQYQQILLLAEEVTNALGKQALNFDLSQILLYWTSWQLYCEADNQICDLFKSQIFSLSGNSKYVLAQSYLVGVLSGVVADCSSIAVSSYDLSNSKRTVLYDFNEFMSDPTCTSIGVSPSLLGYQKILDRNNFRLQVSILATMDCNALNMDILDIDQLQTVASSPSYEISYNGYLYIGQYYIDTIYYGMDPILCFVNSESNVPPLTIGVFKQLCMIPFENTLALPLFLHYGAAPDSDDIHRPKPCYCDAYGHEDKCDDFSLINSLIFFNTSDFTTAALAFIQIRSKYRAGIGMVRAAYNISFASSASRHAPDVDPIIHNPAWRASSYEFCRVNITGLTPETCSLLTLHGYGDSVYDKSLMGYMHILENGSCADSFSLPPEVWTKMRDNPPTRLSEYYMKCTNTQTGAAADALGIAVGNTSLAIPVLAALFLPLLYFILTLTDTLPPVDEYSKEMLEAVNTLIAYQILRFRDGKTLGLTRDGYLSNICKELLASTKGEAGMVDSDDEGDSDDEDDGEDHERAKKPKPQKSASNKNHSASANGVMKNASLLHMKNETAPAPLLKSLGHRKKQQKDKRGGGGGGDDERRSSLSGPPPEVEMSSILSPLFSLKWPFHGTTNTNNTSEDDRKSIS